LPAVLDQCRDVQSSWVSQLILTGQELAVTYYKKNKPNVTCLYPGTSPSWFLLGCTAPSKGRFVHAFLYRRRPYRIIEDPCPIVSLVGTPVGAGSFVLTGQSATGIATQWAQIALVQTGSGISSGATDYTDSADAGSFVLTGQASTGIIGPVHYTGTGGTGSFTVTGQGSTGTPNQYSTITQIQTGTGVSSSSTVSGTWTSTTTAGNFLVAVVTATNSAAITGITAPSGWTLAKFVGNGALAYRAVAIFYKENAAAQSATGNFTVSPGASAGSCVTLAEYSGVKLSSSLDVTASSFADVNSGTFDSGTTGTTAQTKELCIAGYATGSGAHNNDPTNSFGIVVQVENTSVGGTNRSTMSSKIVSATGTQQSSITGTSQKWAAAVATFKAAAA
jgi:hypothetical protein